MNFLKNIQHKADELTQKMQKHKEEYQKKKSEKQAPPPSHHLKHLNKHEHRSIVNVSATSVLKIGIILLGLYYVAQVFGLIGDIFMLLFLAFIIASALDPLVDYFEDKGINRGVTGTILLLLIFGAVGVAIAYVLPVIISQGFSLLNDVSRQFTDGGIHLQQLPFYKEIEPFIMQYLGASNPQDLKAALQQGLGSLGSMSENIMNALFSLFGGIVSAGSVFIMALYMIMDEKHLEDFVKTLTPKQYEDTSIRIMKDMQVKMGGWFRAMIYLMLIMGLTSGIFYAIIGLQFALMLGILAGLMELIPIVGVVIASVPAILLGFITDPWMGVAVLIFISVLQFAEGNILVPMLMKHSVGLSPLTVIIAMLIGGQLMGIMGVILSIPFATMISVFIGSYARYNTELKAEIEASKQGDESIEID